jgi:hypothetical protein
LRLQAQFLNFKLEEEGNITLLLHLPKLFAETAVFGSAVGLSCKLVVASPQVWFRRQRGGLMLPSGDPPPLI